MDELISPEIAAYYELGREHARLGTGRNRLEFWRTQDVLRRFLPPAPARVLDVGGGTGAYAEWLAGEGYDVELVDPVPSHVRQAAERPGVSARLGDARDLRAEPGGFDAVLLLGPLYHLPDRADRVTALREAAAAVRPGGLVAAAAITRYAALWDLVHQGRYALPDVRRVVDDSLGDGVFRGRPDLGFTTAYFHHPGECAAEFAEAGLPGGRTLALEGAFALLGTVNDWLDDPARRELMLAAARRVEEEPALLGAGGHLLTLAVRPAGGVPS